MGDLPDPAIRGLTNTILARPEYHVEPDSDSDLLARLRHWLAHLLDYLMALHGTDPIIFWMIVVASILAALGLILHAFWSVRIALRIGPQEEAPRPVAVERDLIEEARHLAAAGKYLEAGHLLMLASFRMLAERSVIELRPDRSNAWIRSTLYKSRLAGALARELDGLIERTQERWFGNRSNDQEIYSQWQTALERLQQAQ